MQRSALSRSRREPSNEYLLAKIGVDTAENEPLEVWGKIQFIYPFASFLPTGPQLRRAVDGAPGAVGGEQDADVAGDGLGRLHLGGSSQKISGVPTRD